MGKVSDLKFTQEDKSKAYVKFLCENPENLIEVLKEKGEAEKVNGKGFKVQMKEEASE